MVETYLKNGVSYGALGTPSKLAKKKESYKFIRKTSVKQLAKMDT